MKLSDKKTEALYEAIHDPVMNVRVCLSMNKDLGEGVIDKLLHDLVKDIWNRQRGVLGIEESVNIDKPKRAKKKPEPDHDFKCLFCGAVSKKPPCLKCYERGQT